MTTTITPLPILTINPSDAAAPVGPAVPAVPAASVVPAAPAQVVSVAPNPAAPAPASISSAPLTVELQAYQHVVQSMRRSPYLDFPAHVHLETMSLCNADCSFCPYGSVARQGERMSDELIEKILTDLTDIPKLVPFQLSPFKVNEPFLDKRLFDICAKINSSLPHARITLTSNSTPITEDKLDRLSEIKNLAYLWISFNDHRPAEYEQAMKLPYARTIERLATIHARKAAGRLPVRIVLSRVGDGSGMDREFCDFVAQRFPLFESGIFPRGGWLGQVPGLQIGDVPAVGCTRWFDVSITATGVVAHCCMDGKAEHPIGDVSRQHVLDVYNAPEYRALRERTLTRLQAEPCRACTFL
jgi:hypothetical protein